ncbi:polyphosphate kinase 1 [Methylolobus aquaticus]
MHDLSTTPIDLHDPQLYLNRELSWLDFNDRVLQEALDSRTPLLERLKFVAIFSSNLDEYFMVRISGVLEQIAAGVTATGPDGMTPTALMNALRTHIAASVAAQHGLFQHTLRPALSEAGVRLLDYDTLDAAQLRHLQTYFEQHVFPVLTPLSVDAAHPFPIMSNLSLNLAVIVEDPVNSVQKLARVKVPDTLPRFVTLPESLRPAGTVPTLWAGVTLEQLIANNLQLLFPGMRLVANHLFRITRDADFPVKEDEAEDLLLAIEQEISKRRIDGFVCRLEIERTMPKSLREKLMADLEISDRDIYEIDGLLHLKDLFFFMSVPLPEMKDPPWSGVVPPRLRYDPTEEPGSEESGPQPGALFAEIRKGDLLVHHPYESFAASVQAFIQQAAHDPLVLAIKMTLYRTSGDSPIVAALIAAAAQHKQVVVLVEIKARFDEENNIIWAKKLEEAGVHVVYGVMGLKTHTKTVLVVREEGAAIRRYVHIGTGNYNPKTAMLYTDLGLLSCREELGQDLTDLFNYLTGYSRQEHYRKLLVAPLTLRSGMEALIRREMEQARGGGEGRIVAKMNSLVDERMIRLLYEASQAGVQIDLIIRGICCLRPGVPGVSENIRVTSIIGRYLEHARIFRFHNAGQDEFYIGSADWMTRNLDRRVEAVTPIEDPALCQELRELLRIMLDDNRQAWDLGADGRYVQRRPADGEPERPTQALTMQRTLARTA